MNRPEEEEQSDDSSPTIGIVSPGDMGHALGAILVQHGLRVLTNLQGRSARTVALATQAGITDVGDDETLVREDNMLLSVLVPAQAHAFAERMAAALYRLVERTELGAETPEERHRGQTLAEVVGILADASLNRS